MTDRSVKCDLCDRMFKDVHGKTQHMADTHSIGKRPRTPERYHLYIDDADIHAEYEPQQFSMGLRDDDF